MFCVECGFEIKEGQKFCTNCGAPVEQTSSALRGTVRTVSNINNYQTVNQIRTVQLRCKTCNGVLNTDGTSNVLMCPYCGSKEIFLDDASVRVANLQTNAYRAVESERIRAQHNIEMARINMEAQTERYRMQYNSIQNLVKQLADIDAEKDGFWQTMISGGKDAINREKCRRKINLINSFIVPNTIEDVFEFMKLADANINARLSVNSFSNRWNSRREEDIKPEKLLSDAWLAKMRSVYRNAFNTLNRHPGFSQIANIYANKMRILKMKY